jgi:catechol 2,3-dioxygenase-like lactoylglutathione lyase family enzyme
MCTKEETTMPPSFQGGVNIAMKIPADRFDATVAFYRTTLGFALSEEDVSDTPSLSRSFSLRFGPVVLWLDRVGPDRRTEVWLEVETSDLEAARERLATDGIQPCDHVEPLPGLGERMHWIRNPAGVVHLLKTSD